MTKLIEQGVISGVHATIDHAALGRPLEVTMDVWIDHRPNDTAFLDLVSSDDRIVDAIHITGPVDFRLLVQVASPEDLEDLLAKMRREAGVTQTDSRIVMSHIATTLAIG
jgi:Lrp/AsnC family leucine-responsive transcriptional regulator